jgi:hypothetical protein
MEQHTEELRTKLQLIERALIVLMRERRAEINEQARRFQAGEDAV